MDGVTLSTRAISVANAWSHRCSTLCENASSSSARLCTAASPTGAASAACTWHTRARCRQRSSFESRDSGVDAADSAAAADVVPVPVPEAVPEAVAALALGAAAALLSARVSSSCAALSVAATAESIGANAALSESPTISDTH